MFKIQAYLDGVWYIELLADDRGEEREATFDDEAVATRIMFELLKTDRMLGGSAARIRRRVVPA